MLREVFSALVVSGVVRLNTDSRNSVADDLLFSLHDVFSDTADSAVDTALQEPRFTVTPAVTRRTARRAMPPPPPAADPPPSGAVSPPTTGRQRKTTSTASASAAAARALATAPVARAPPKTSSARRKGKGPAKSRVSPPAVGPREDDDPIVPDPALPPAPSSMETDDLGDTAATAPASQPTTTAAPPAASRGHGDDDEQLDTPELRRGLSANLERMENTLRDPTQLVEAQQRDPTLGPIRALLEAGRGNGTNYVLADDHLLWLCRHAFFSPGRFCRWTSRT